MLTRVLRACFVDNDHRSCIIATVSPTPTDLDHTLNTLNHVVLCADGLEKRKWTHEVEVPFDDKLEFMEKPVALVSSPLQAMQTENQNKLPPSCKLITLACLVGAGTHVVQ